MVTRKPSPERRGKKTSQPLTFQNVTSTSPPKIDPADPKWYLNRELTWLDFKRRVLHEAEDERVPLLERLKFIAIVSANIDEFFMKRIGGLKQQIGAGCVNSPRTAAHHANRCWNATPA